MADPGITTMPGTPVPWRPWTIALPAMLAGGVTVLLGAVGWMVLGLGIGSNCTDDYSCGSGFCAPCQAESNWAMAGSIGQWPLAAAALVLLIAGLRRPAARRRLAAWTWALTPLALAWITLAGFAAAHSF